MKNNRFKNHALWTAMASLVGLILTDVGLITAGEYETYVQAIFAVGIAAGIINNPSNGKGFKDLTK